MGIYADIIAEKRQQVEEILGIPYDGRRYTSPTACPSGALNLIADIKVLEAEERQMEIMSQIGGAGAHKATILTPEQQHLPREYEALKKDIELWKPYMTPEKKTGR